MLAHVAEDHPSLAETETAEDIRTWIELLPEEVPVFAAQPKCQGDQAREGHDHDHNHDHGKKKRKK